MLPELKVTQLRHFAWVAELKGFRAAAEKAHRTQPAISLSVAGLEERLGEALFEKGNARMTTAKLTPFGQYFYPKAKELIAHHDRIAEDMVLLSKHKTGHLRIASVPSIASRVLPDLLQEFMSASPDLHISFYDDNSAAVLQMVEAQKVDFGIAHLFHKEEHQDKEFISIWQDQIGVVCPKDHPLAQHESVHWTQLKQHRLISNGTSRLLEDSEARPLLERSQFYVSNMISLIAMLEAGFGVTTLPWYAFPQDSTKLSFIPLADPQLVRRIGIVVLKNTTLSPPAQGLVDFILKRSSGEAPRG